MYPPSESEGLAKRIQDVAYLYTKASLKVKASRKWSKFFDKSEFKKYFFHRLIVYLRYSPDSDCISSRSQAALSLAVFVWPVTSVLLVFGMPSVNARMGVRPFMPRP